VETAFEVRSASSFVMLRNQKLRTFLTVFGLVWWDRVCGDAPSRVRRGAEEAARQERGRARGPDLHRLARAHINRVPGLGKGRRIRLTEEDVEYVRVEGRGASRDLERVRGDDEAALRTKTWPVDVSGVSPEFGRMRSLIPQSGGRFLNETDMEQRRRVVFLGDKLAENLFGKEPAVGKTVMMWGSPFLVVGVLKPKTQDSSYSGRDNDKASIPGSTSGR